MANTTDLSGFNLPDISKADMSYGGGNNPQYKDIMGQIQKAGNLPGLTETVMPSIMQLLSPEGQKLSPYAQALEVKTGQNVAQTQTDMMKRGLTGSDIEMQGMGQARAAGQTALAEMYAQTADQLSQMIYQAASGDLANNRELLMTLAQAMGQELTSQRDMEMFQQALKASVAEAENMRNAQKNSSMWGGIGSLVGTGAGMLIGNAVAPGIGGVAVGGMMGGGMGRSVGAIGANQ